MRLGCRRKFVLTVGYLYGLQYRVLHHFLHEYTECHIVTQKYRNNYYQIIFIVYRLKGLKIHCSKQDVLRLDHVIG